MQDQDPTENGHQPRRQRNTTQETALAQLFKNAHDAGDADAMRSLGRELQRRGWEYGETVPGWPYIKPPAGFQAVPGVDATASLRAIIQRPPESRSGLQSVANANPVVQAAADLRHNAAALLKTVGGTLAGIPKTVADIALTPTEQATNIIGDLSGPKYYPGYYFWRLPAAGARAVIEENPVSQKIEGAGQRLQQVAQSEMAKARPGIVSDIEQTAFGYGPVALLPGGIPAIAAQTYLQRRGEGATEGEALAGAGETAAGLELGGKIAGTLGEGYLSRVLGYTVGPTAINQIEQAIETGQLPDPRQVGIDAFKNAVFAANFGAMHGSELSRTRPLGIGESPGGAERAEPLRTMPGADWTASGQRSGLGILEGIQRTAGGGPEPGDTAPVTADPDRTEPSSSAGLGILKGIRRIAGGALGPADVPVGSEIGPARELGITSDESRPTYEEVAARRLGGSATSGGMLAALRRYSQLPTVWEKIYHHVFGSWPARAPGDAMELGPSSGYLENPNLAGQNSEVPFKAPVGAEREKQQSPFRVPIPPADKIASAQLTITPPAGRVAGHVEPIMAGGAESVDWPAGKTADSLRRPDSAGDEQVGVDQSAQPSVANGVGAWTDVHGHHIHAKSGLREHPSYDPRRGFSISQEFMRGRGWRHEKMTATQQRLFRELSASGRANTLREHTRIAVEALKAGGATETEARELVAQSLQDLRRQRVRAPTRVPWTKNGR